MKSKNPSRSDDVHTHVYINLHITVTCSVTFGIAAIQAIILYCARTVYCMQTVSPVLPRGPEATCPIPIIASVGTQKVCMIQYYNILLSL